MLVCNMLVKSTWYCGARPAGVDREARLAPHLGGTELLRVHQRRRHQRAAVVGVALREPASLRPRRLAGEVKRARIILELLA